MSCNVGRNDASAWSAFYGNGPILEAPAEIRASRLALAAATLRQLQQALDLLGIEIPERM